MVKNNSDLLSVVFLSFSVIFKAAKSELSECVVFFMNFIFFNSHSLIHTDVYFFGTGRVNLGCGSRGSVRTQMHNSNLFFDLQN